MNNQAKTTSPGDEKSKRKKAARIHARVRIQKKQKAKIGSSGMIDTVKASRSPDALRYEREHKVASGSVEEIQATQEQHKLTPYMKGHRQARGEIAISEDGYVYNKGESDTDNAASLDGYFNALREGTTLSVQILASRTGQTYKQVWRKRKALAVGVILRGKVLDRAFARTASSEELREIIGGMDTRQQVSLYHTVFTYLVNPY